MSSFSVARGQATVAGAAPNPITLRSKLGPLDLTSATVKARYRLGSSAVGSFDSAEAAATEISPTIVDAATGKIALILSSSFTAALEIGATYQWRIDVTLAGGQREMILISMAVVEGF